MENKIRYILTLFLCISIHTAYAIRLLPGSITSQSVGVFWDKPIDYQNVKEYKVYVNEQFIASTLKNHYTAQNLKSRKQYNVYVKFVYNDGHKTITNHVQFETRPSGRKFNIIKYGAKAGERLTNTKAIQAAIDACTPHGTVYIPKGIFVTGALFVKKSNITLYLEKGAVLKASSELEDFPLIKTRYEGRLTSAYASILNIGDLESGNRYKNIAIVGEGIIDGQGSVLANKQTLAMSRTARAHGLPIINCDNVYLMGVTIQNPPTWCIHPIYSCGVTTDRITIYSDGFGVSNADGWDPDSSRDCYLLNSVLNTHDDHIAIKSGIDAEGRQVNIPSENIYVSHCHFLHGGGIAVGSEMSGGIKNVRFEDCIFENADRGFHVKSRPGRGGKVDDILFRDIIAERFGRWGLSVDMWYYQMSYIKSERTLKEIPEFKNICFENIHIKKVTGPAILIVGLQESAINGIQIKNVKIDEQFGRSLFRDCKNVALENVFTNNAFCEMDRTENVCMLKDCDLINKYSFNYALTDPHATYTTQAMFHNLMKIAQQDRFLFGQQDATASGYGWKDDSGRSDIKEITNKYPSFYSWDYLDFIQPEGNNSTVEKKIRKLTTEAYSRGSVNSYCWHFFNPSTDGSFYDTTVVVKRIIPGGDLHEKYKKTLNRVGEYAKSLVGIYGESIPIIFRPFHENDGSWFWWGANHCAAEEFKQLYRFTVTYLRDSLDVHNFIYAFSPDCKFNSLDEFLARYPGDEYVDLIGMDNYWDLRYEHESSELAHRKLKILSDYAVTKNKLCALTETGQKKIENPKWFTGTLLKAINGYPDKLKLSYVSVWRNSKNGFFTPYRGHPGEADFIDFCNRKEVILNDKIPMMYYIEE